MSEGESRATAVLHGAMRRLWERAYVAADDPQQDVFKLLCNAGMAEFHRARNSGKLFFQLTGNGRALCARLSREGWSL